GSGQGAPANQAVPGASTPSPAPSANAMQAPRAVAPQGQGGDRRGGFGGRGLGGGSGQDAAGAGQGGGRRFDPARMMERFKGMSPDEQQQFIARMKERGVDTSAFETELKANAAAAKKAGPASTSQPQGAQTIDALFAPLPATETFGRAWLFMDHQL